MKTHSLSAYKNITKPKTTTVKGVILNNNIKTSKEPSLIDKCEKDLLIPNINSEKSTNEPALEKFDEKKAIKPLLIGTGATIGAIGAISLCALGYSKSLAKGTSGVQPPDLARNINIVEEPHFAMYRALREPNAKNILGLIGVGLMSGVTLCSKNLVDGAKEIWIKKQECDLNYQFQKDSIDAETKAFSGKLNVINSMLAETSQTLKNEIGFKGKNDTDKKDESKNKNLKIFAATAAAAAGFSILACGIFKNYQKTVKNLDTFMQKSTDSEIKNKISQAINTENKEEAIKKLTNILKNTNATDEKIKSNLSSIKGITEEEINEAFKNIKNSQIYVQAPEALGGVSEKIQYYCYINEDRGHLYNWILNPENKFNKYVFLSFSAISSIGYISRTVVDAIKSVTVKKENNKSELNLKNELVNVEIENFKSKKTAALNPMLDNFYEQKKQGKSKEELEEIAQNILHEIKNGPPYVYD